MRFSKIDLKSKLPHVGTTIFTTMSALANETGAINLSQGFPDFETSKLLKDLVYKYMLEGKNQYAPLAGIPELRNAIAQKVKSSYDVEINPDNEINITAGATQAIFTVISAVVNPGDEVMVFAPAYDCYTPAIELMGGKVIEVPIMPPNYSIDWEKVAGLISNKTRMIMINSPHNPSGSLLNARDMQKLEALTKNTNIMILSDEVYEHIVFDGHKHESALKYPGIKERSFCVYSFGKTFHHTGWKMGYVIAPKEMMQEFRKVHQYNVFTVNTPMQYALAEYMKDPATYQSIPAFYQEKRDFFAHHLKNSRFKLLPCKGTYFQLLDYSAITSEKDTDFAIRLTKAFGVASIPTSVFYEQAVAPKVLRFCFAKTEETLEKAGKILCTV